MPFLEALTNFAYSTVATAPSPASSGTSLVVQSGDGAKFPNPPFWIVVWAAGANPLTTNAEVCAVTAVSTDTLTIVRAQDGSSARSIVVGDQVMLGMTAALLEQIRLNPKVYGRFYDEFVTTTAASLWTNGSSGGSLGGSAAAVGHFGTIGLASGGTTNNLAAMYQGAGSGNNTIINTNDHWYVEWEFQTPATLGNANIRMGICQASGAYTSNPPAQWIGFEFLTTDTNIFVVCRAAGAQTRTDTGQALATSTWYTLQLYYDGTNLLYAVNRASPTKIASPTNYPANLNAGLFAHHFNPAGAASVTYNIDYVQLINTDLAR